MRITAWMGALALLATAATAQELPADPRLQGFEPIGDYVVRVDGRTVEADVYHSQKAGSGILLTAPALPSPVVVLPGDRAVRGLPADKLVTRGDGTVDVLSGAPFTEHGAFEVANGQVAFTVGPHQVRLEEKPWLLGWQQNDDMLAYSAGYRFIASQYRPSTPMLRQLAAVQEPIKVRVYFGTWCPHCKQNVPKLLRVAEELEGSKISFEYYGLPSPFGEEPQARKEGINAVPSAVVFKNGREIGRLASADWRIPELGLKKLIVGG